MGTKSEAAKRSWKQWKPEQARRELEAWRSSGLTLTNYAERRGVTTTRLRYWHARLGEPASSEMRLVPAKRARQAASAASCLSAEVVEVVVERLDSGLDLVWLCPPQAIAPW